MSKELLEQIKKASGSLPKEKLAVLEEVFGNQEVSKVLKDVTMMRSDYSKRQDELKREREELNKKVQEGINGQKTTIEAQLKADYEKKVKEVENFKNLVAQQAGLQLQQEQAKAFQLQQEIQKANQQMQALIGEVAPYDDGVKILSKLGLAGFQGYGNGLVPAQPQGYGYNNGFQQNNPYQQGFQQGQGYNNGFNQNPYGQPQFVQQGYQNGQGYGQQGFQPQQPQKQQTIEEILAAIMPKIQETYQPNINTLAQLPFELTNIANEHYKLTGEHLNTKALYEKAQALEFKKTPFQVWEEEYDIPTKRIEAEKKAYDDKLEAIVKTRLDEELAKQKFPSEKPVDYSLSNSSYFSQDKSAEPSSQANEQIDQVALESKSYVGEAMNALAAIQQNK